MRKAAMLALALLLRADAGVAVLDAVSSCPSITKTVITGDTLLWDEFLPVEAPELPESAIIDAVVADSAVLPAPAAPSKPQTAWAGFVPAPAVLIADTLDMADAISAESGHPLKNVVRMLSKRLKFGRRAAFNYSMVTNMRARIYSHDGESFSYTEYGNKAGFGIGFEVAGIIGAALSDAAALNFSPGVVFRKPFNTAVVGISEVAVSFPMLLEWAPVGFLPLRLYGGFMAGLPLYARVKWNGEKSVAFEERAAADFGFAAGVGGYIGDKAFVDLRWIWGLSEYDRVGGRRLNQLAAGVNYIK
jgi:hypothetical protein